MYKDNENGVILNDILQQAYLSSTANDKSWNALRVYIKQTSKDEDLSSIVDFMLVQLGSRNDLHFRINLLALIRSANEDNKQLTSFVFDGLMRQISSLKDISPSTTFAKQIMCYSKLCTLFSWTDLSAESQKTFVEAHSILCTFFGKCKSKSLYDNNYKLLKRILNSCNFDEYLSILKSFTSNMNACILWDNVIRFAVDAGISNFFDLHKDIIMDVFIKNIIMSKTKIPDIVGSFCFANTLGQLSFDDFKTTLFPSLQKAILRSAETSLVLVAFLLDFLNFDLSNLSQEIGKILGNYLHSKEDSLQEQSVNSVKIVSSKCENLASLEFLIRHFCKIYNGSEGKLAVLTQKNSVLKAIGLLSFNGLKEQPDRQAAFNLAISELIHILKQETTESSVVVAFSQVKQWIVNSKGLELSDSFWKYVKEFKKSKLATSLTITSLYDCLNYNIYNLPNLDTIYLEDDIINTLINSSRNMTSSLAKINVVTESLYSSVILLNIYKKEKSLDSKLKNFFNI